MDYDHLKRSGSSTAIGQQVGQQAGLNQPKEIGILPRVPRVDGLRSGLQELRNSIEGFVDRLEGAGSSNNAKGQAPVAASLTGTLSDAENELRTCRQMIESLHDRF